MNALPDQIDGWPNLCGSEEKLASVIREARERRPHPPPAAPEFGRLRSAFAVALHMHQPLIPAGGDDLRTAALISNLQHMLEHPHEGDNHNAPVFHWCYKRMGEFVPQLMAEGKQPRVMLEYSGTLLYGLRRMGLNDVLESLRRITCEEPWRQAVEWLGCPWGHAVAPSTPVQDFRLHVRAWQHYFAALFGWEAAGRVRGFSPSEMALPNHPDVAYEFVRTLRECGYEWVLVQEHTVERPENGHGPDRKHIPHRLVCTNSRGDRAEIIAIVKTQGSDTKLVAQMQPYYEAMSLGRWELAGRSVPPLVTQIADGENGGVMMNEFPGKYLESMQACSGSETPAMNVSEYLDQLEAQGLHAGDFPALQPIFQKRIWDRFQPGGGPEKLDRVIETLRREDSRFHMEGGSWTNSISWVRGYQDLLGPMETVSALFSERLEQRGIPPSDPRYRRALLHLLASQTSCYRYWGQGRWVDYGREICRRLEEMLQAL